MRRSAWTSFSGILLGIAASVGLGALTQAAEPTPESVELFGDLDFSDGFVVVNGAKELGVLRLPTPGATEKPDENAAPVWKLAQHASKYDLSKAEVKATPNCSEVVTPGQRVALERNENGELTLFLDVKTDKEYAAPRKFGEPWIHLLLVHDFPVDERVSFGDVDSVVFSCDARVPEWKRLMSPEEFDVNVHATQASVYFAISNDNPNSPDYRDFIWFGISFFDDRYEIQTQYIAIDGDPKTIGTGKLIYRLGEQKTIDDLMGGVNPYTKEWVHIKIDLAKYVGGMLKAAQERGLLTRTTVDELKLSHFNFGWETPGTYEASLALKNLRLDAAMKKRAE